MLAKAVSISVTPCYGGLGEDTDTIAAIAGGLAGIYYGIGGKNGIPEEWIERIARLDYIKALCDEFDSTFFTKEITP